MNWKKTALFYASSSLSNWPRKTLQDYLAQESGYVDVKGARVVIKQAIQDGFFADGHLWLQMLLDRNELTYSDDEEKSRAVLESISTTYVGLLINLDKSLASKL